MSATVEEYDPEAAIWETVAELKRKAFTKDEIAEALYHVADNVTDD